MMPTYDKEAVSKWLKEKRPQWMAFTVFFDLPKQKLFACNYHGRGRVDITSFIAK